MSDWMLARCREEARALARGEKVAPQVRASLVSWYRGVLVRSESPTESVTTPVNVTLTLLLSECTSMISTASLLSSGIVEQQKGLRLGDVVEIILQLTPDEEVCWIKSVGTMVKMKVFQGVDQQIVVCADDFYDMLALSGVTGPGPAMFSHAPAIMGTRDTIPILVLLNGMVDL